MRESERGGKRVKERETAEMKKMKQDLNQSVFIRLESNDQHMMRSLM